MISISGTESKKTCSRGEGIDSNDANRLSMARCMQSYSSSSSRRNNLYIGVQVLFRWTQYRPTVLNIEIIGLRIKFNWFISRNKSTSRVAESYHTSFSLRARAYTSPTEGNFTKQVVYALQKGMNQSSTLLLPSNCSGSTILLSSSMTLPSYPAVQMAQWIMASILAFSSGVSSSVSLARRAFMNFSGASDLVMVSSSSLPYCSLSSPLPTTPTLERREFTWASWVDLLRGDSKVRKQSICQLYPHPGL